MRVARKPKTDQEQVLTLNRRLRDLRHIASRLKRSRMTPRQVCEAIIEKRLADRSVRPFFSGLPDDERHYWIASLYALLMPKARRRRLAEQCRQPDIAALDFEERLALMVDRETTERENKRLVTRLQFAQLAAERGGRGRRPQGRARAQQGAVP